MMLKHTSNGGRQGLLEGRRYPDDYDGFVIGARSERRRLGGVGSQR